MTFYRHPGGKGIAQGIRLGGTCTRVHRYNILGGTATYICNVNYVCWFRDFMRHVCMHGYMNVRDGKVGIE